MTTILDGLRTGAWRLVPVEMTREMNNAGSYCQINEKGLADEVYAAMLSASPDATAALLAEIEGLRGAVLRQCAREADDMAASCREERSGLQASSVGSTGAVCLSIGGESSAKALASSFRAATKDRPDV